MQPLSRNKTAAIIALLLLVSAGIRLYYAWQPLPELLRQGMADDAFYYLSIARNLARGLGSSFDGLSPTNGYHPLYALLLVPLFKLLPSAPETVARLGLSLLMLCNLITALPLYGSLARINSPAAGLFAVFLWLFNPWVMIFSLGGVESSVYILFAALSVYAYIRLLSAPDGRRYPWAASLGFCLGLTILARSDGIFLLSAILLEGAARSFRNGWTVRHPFERGWLLQAPVMLACCAALLAPWLVWNSLTFGNPTQVSGLAVYWQTHYGITTWAAWWTTLLQSTVRTVSGSLYFSMQALLVGFLLLLVCVVLIRKVSTTETQSTQILLNLKMLSTPNSSAENLFSPSRAKNSSSTNRILWVVGLYAAHVIAFYAFYLWQQQFWYFMPLLYAATIFGGIFFGKLAEASTSYDRRFQRFIQGVAITAALLVGGVAWYGWQSGWLQLYPAQRNALWIAGQLSTRAEPGARIGAWNSGILGYLSDRTVVDLDGVVNNELYRFVRPRQVSFFDLCALWEYIQASQVDYLTDYEDAWSSDVEKTFDGRLVLWAETTSVPEAGNYKVRIYRVVKQEQPLSVRSCPGVVMLHK